MAPAAPARAPLHLSLSDQSDSPPASSSPPSSSTYFESSPPQSPVSSTSSLSHSRGGVEFDRAVAGRDAGLGGGRKASVSLKLFKETALADEERRASGGPSPTKGKGKAPPSARHSMPSSPFGSPISTSTGAFPGAPRSRTASRAGSPRFPLSPTKPSSPAVVPTSSAHHSPALFAARASSRPASPRPPPLPSSAPVSRQQSTSGPVPDLSLPTAALPIPEPEPDPEPEDEPSFDPSPPALEPRTSSSPPLLKLVYSSRPPLDAAHRNAPSSRRASSGTDTATGTSSECTSGSEWSDDDEDEDGDDDGSADDDDKAFEYELDDLPLKDAASMTLSPAMGPAGGVGRLLDDDGRRAATVPLEPFKHQVGGHSHIFRFSKKAVCKVCLFFRLFDASQAHA